MKRRFGLLSCVLATALVPGIAAGGPGKGSKLEPEGRWAAYLPNIVVQAVEVHETTSPRNPGYEQPHLVIRVANLGPLPCGSFPLYYFAMINGSSVTNLYDHRIVPGLLPFEQATITVSLPPTPGTFQKYLVSATANYDVVSQGYGAAFSELSYDDNYLLVPYAQ